MRSVERIESSEVKTIAARVRGRRALHAWTASRTRLLDECTRTHPCAESSCTRATASRACSTTSASKARPAHARSSEPRSGSRDKSSRRFRSTPARSPPRRAGNESGFTRPSPDLRASVTDSSRS